MIIQYMMAWKQTYVEYENMQKSQASSGTGNSIQGSVFVIVNTAAHIAQHIAQVQDILAPGCADSDTRSDEHPQRRKMELNAHIFSAITGLQSLFDAVASACNAEEPRVTGDVSFFPGREDREYRFVTPKFLSIQKYKTELLLLPCWGGKSFNQIANALKHECPFCGVPTFSDRKQLWDIDKDDIGLLRDILEPAWRILLATISYLAKQNNVPMPPLIAI